MLALRPAEVTPTATSRCVASDADRTRKAADLPGFGSAGDEGEAAVSGQLLHAPARANSRRGVTCSAYDLGTLGVNGFPLEAVEREHLVCSRRRPAFVFCPLGGEVEAGGGPVAARRSIIRANSGPMPRCRRRRGSRR